MARIVIANLFEKTLEVSNLSRTLLQHFQDHYLDWLHTCGGKGRCTTCKVIILKGSENLAAATEAELKYRQAGELGASERLSCQTTIQGDVRVAVPNDCKLLHIRYSDDLT